MKKKYIFSSIIIFFIIIIILNFYILNKKTNNNLINDIKKSLVVISPEKNLVNFNKNPSGILWLWEEAWIWMGFFYDNNWKILTVNHIINNPDINYIVKTYDNKEYLAKIIQKYKKNDLAILEIDTKTKYNKLNLSKDFQKLKIWDKIISFWVDTKNLTTNYLTGNITHISKKLDNLDNLIEFFPLIKNGFSGGPIVNNSWEVIWINSSIYNNKSYGIKPLSKFLQ